jgi:DNA repair photolyase
MNKIKSKPLAQYSKRIGKDIFCPRGIYSDLVAACSAKKQGKSCVYCFVDILEGEHDSQRSFERGFKLKELKDWLNRRPGRLSNELKDIKVVRINANTDFYPELDEINAEHIDLFTRNGIKVIVITKQYLNNIPKTVEATKNNSGVLQVTFNFLDKEKAKDFEPYWTDIEEKKSGIEKYIKEFNERIILRIAPIIIGVNDDDAYKIMEWFKSIGGKRAIIHFLRKDHESLNKAIKKWGGRSTKNEFYSNEEMTLVIETLKNIGLEMNICAEYELNKRYGGSVDCCFI